MVYGFSLEKLEDVGIVLPNWEAILSCQKQIMPQELQSIVVDDLLSSSTNETTFLYFNSSKIFVAHSFSVKNL